MRTIRVDDDVWKALQRRATAFEDTPNSVLRRVLRLDNPDKQKGSTPRIPRGTKTPQQLFKEPILKALYELGGSAECSEVLNRVGALMRGKLNEVDYQTLSDGKTLRWRKTAQWERNEMTNEGLIKKGSPRGIWELTAKGIAEAENVVQQ